MKKTLALILSLLLALSLTGAFADDLGVTIIGGDDPVATEPLDLDDMQVGATYEIPGYAKISPLDFVFVDSFAQYNAGTAGNNSGRNTGDNDWPVFNAESNPGDWMWYFDNIAWKDSGTSADFAWLTIDVTNLKKTDVIYGQEATVKVVYDDEYEYAGWVRQFNFDYNNFVFRRGHEGSFASPATLDPTDEEAVGMVYTGHFVFGCTLPNVVVEDKNAPLKMVIDLGGNELTYNIRK